MAGGDTRVTLRCKDGPCIRTFSDCDHRANGEKASLDLDISGAKTEAARKALAHMFALLKARRDPFVSE